MVKIDKRLYDRIGKSAEIIVLLSQDSTNEEFVEEIENSEFEYRKNLFKDIHMIETNKLDIRELQSLETIQSAEHNSEFHENNPIYEK